MRFVHLTSQGQLELNYLWLPTWLGINQVAATAVMQQLKSKVVGLPATEDNLDIINTMVIDVLAEKYPSVEGLRDYLDGLKFVRT